MQQSERDQRDGMQRRQRWDFCRCLHRRRVRGHGRCVCRWHVFGRRDAEEWGVYGLRSGYVLRLWGHDLHGMFARQLLQRDGERQLHLVR